MCTIIETMLHPSRTILVPHKMALIGRTGIISDKVDEQFKNSRQCIQVRIMSRCQTHSSPYVLLRLSGRYRCLCCSSPPPSPRRLGVSARVFVYPYRPTHSNGREPVVPCVANQAPSPIRRRMGPRGRACATYCGRAETRLLVVLRDRLRARSGPLVWAVSPGHRGEFSTWRAQEDGATHRHDQWTRAGSESAFELASGQPSDSGPLPRPLSGSTGQND